MNTVNERNRAQDIPAMDNPIGFQKLREVVIEREEIRGQLPVGGEDEGEPSGWWNPLEAYYRAARAGSERPYKAFYKCGTGDADVKRFAETHGLIKRGGGESGLTASMSLAEFQFEQWQFFFIVFLHGSMKAPDTLRKAFSRAVDGMEKHQSGAGSSRWIDAAWGIWDAIVRTPLRSTLADLRQRIRDAEDARLIAAARTYTGQVVRQHLKDTRILFEYQEDGSSRLSTRPVDLLTAFYFMLASDWTMGLDPVRWCACCGNPFRPNRQNATYCSRCKEKGPLKMSWARHGADYVRKRREDRAQKRAIKAAESTKP